MMRKIIPFAIIILGIIFLLTDNEPAPIIKKAEQDFEYFILIEYDSEAGDFEIISDMLDKSACLDSILQIECLKERPIQKNRVESVKLKINK